MAMIPAHMLFMHLNPETAGEASLVVSRLRNNFIRFLDLALVVVIFYHAAYGLISLVKDYLASGILRTVVVWLSVLIPAVFAFIGIKILFNI